MANQKMKRCKMECWALKRLNCITDRGSKVLESRNKIVFRFSRTFSFSESSALVSHKNELCGPRTGVARSQEFSFVSKLNDKFNYVLVGRQAVTPSPGQLSSNLN